jgi:hypothetical protein
MAQASTSQILNGNSTSSRLCGDALFYTGTHKPPATIRTKFSVLLCTRSQHQWSAWFHYYQTISFVELQQCAAARLPNPRAQCTIVAFMFCELLLFKIYLLLWQGQVRITVTQKYVSLTLMVRNADRKRCGGAEKG